MPAFRSPKELMRQTMESRCAAHLGRSIIFGLWLATAYLAVFYTVLLWFGPDRLHHSLGDRLYNSLFPNGGFLLLLGMLLVVAIWALPLAAFGGLSAMVLRLLPRRAPGHRLVLRALLLGATATALLHLGSLDGWPDLTYPYLLGDDTEFAPGYSAVGFWRVRAGMTPDEVVSLVGEPLERYPIQGHPNEEGWRWTRSPHSADYRVRVVRFRDRRVSERFSEYYVD
jgi:hypothetical protein